MTVARELGARESDAESVAPSGRERQQFMKFDVGDVWLTDSGALRHVTYRRDWFADYTLTDDGNTITLGDNGTCEVLGVGTVLVSKCIGGRWTDARIENVLYAPRLKKNLFFVGVCTSKGFEVFFKRDRVVLSRGDTIAAVGLKQANEIYRIMFRPRMRDTKSDINVATTSLQT